jgi:hypothetical protein
MLNLRSCVNAVRGRLFGGCDSGEGWERRTLIQRIRIWSARRKLEKLLRQRRSSFEHQSYIRRREAALKGLGRA